MKRDAKIQFIEGIFMKNLKKCFTGRKLINMNYFHVIDKSINVHDLCFIQKNVFPLLLFYMRAI